ncbi:hypothetical protein JKP88DRAFT_193998, partial [Tribonema minus]
MFTSAFRRFGLAILRPSISCPEHVRTALTADAVHLLNSISQQVHSEQDPGLFIMLGDPAIVHAALHLPNAPVAFGASETASVANFRNWLIAASGVPPVSPGVLAWERLTIDQLEEIKVRIHRQAWTSSLQNANITQQQLAMIYQVTGSGRMTHMV